MNRVYWIAPFAVAIAACLTQAGCSGQASERPAEADAAAGAAPVGARSPSETLDVPADMLANVKVEQVREQLLPQWLRATGKVQFNEDRTARVLAPLPGQVLNLQARLGDQLEKGAVVFSIKSREVAGMVTDYLDSQRDRDLAEKTCNMTRDLFEHNAASRIALQQAEGDFAKAKDRVARAEEALRVLELDPVKVQQSGGLQTLVPVRTPLAGTVIERVVTPGQFVQADSTALLTVADLDTVWVMVDVFERDIHLVHKGQRVQVTATAYPDRRFTASVDYINNKVDPETRTLKVRLLVSNPGQLLKPEMFITAALAVNESVRGITVPATALFTEGDHGYVFTAVGDRKFQRRAVVGAPDGEGRLRVSSGVRPGDRVVTDGALLLRFRQTEQQN